MRNKVSTLLCNINIMKGSSTQLSGNVETFNWIVFSFKTENRQPSKCKVFVLKLNFLNMITQNENREPLCNVLQTFSYETLFETVN